MKTYEIFTEKYSQIIQAGNLRAAIKKFIDKNPGDEIIGIHNVKYNDKLLSPSTALKQLSDEEIKDFCKKMKKLYTSNFRHWEHTDNNALLLTKDLIAISLSASPLKEEKTKLNIEIPLTEENFDEVCKDDNISEKEKHFLLSQGAYKIWRSTSQSDHINPIELLEWVQKECYFNGGKLKHYDSSASNPSQLIQTFKNRKA